MSYQAAEPIEKKIHWRGTIPASCPSCMRFRTLADAGKHARETSKEKTEVRHVIHTGDYYFSSTTAIIFWYEQLIISYRNGIIVTVDQLKYYDGVNENDL